MRRIFLWLLLVALSIGCQPGDVQSAEKPSAGGEKAPTTTYGAPRQQSIKEEVPQQLEVREAIKEKFRCEFKDGIHAASVGYFNPDTGHTATYELKVHISNCAVVRIDFPNGGWLDEDHITPTAIDKKGKTKLTDDKGRRWEVHVINTNKMNQYEYQKEAGNY